jgi:hypothetical protein
MLEFKSADRDRTVRPNLGNGKKRMPENGRRRGLRHPVPDAAAGRDERDVAGTRMPVRDRRAGRLAWVCWERGT